MDVYLNGNWSTGRRESKLMALPVHRTFLWEKQEIYIPAIYVGNAGAVLDVCAKIPITEMATFLKKWPKERRLSLRTHEDYEQIDADNPGSQNFLVEMSLDDIPLQLGSGSTINWYPETVFRLGNEAPTPTQEDEWKNDKAAETLMEAYGCDRESCWHFGRFHFSWKDEPVLSPHNVTLDFQAKQIPVTSGYFTTITNTTDQQNEKTIKTTHPVTGQEYTLTLYDCEQCRHSFADIGAKDMLYPEYCHVLSYCVSPEISRELFDIRDCAESDQPRKKESPEESCNEQGATAIFMAGKSAFPERRMAASSMHFEPVPEIRWRMVFQIRAKANLEIPFSI